MQGPTDGVLLVIAETSLALVLLVGAGHLINSFVRLRSVDVGSEPDGLLTFQRIVEGMPGFEARSVGTQPERWS